jgi:hypothetical protein
MVVGKDDSVGELDRVGAAMVGTGVGAAELLVPEK